MLFFQVSVLKASSGEPLRAGQACLEAWTSQEVKHGAHLFFL